MPRKTTELPPVRVRNAEVTAADAERVWQEVARLLGGAGARPGGGSPCSA